MKKAVVLGTNLLTSLGCLCLIYTTDFFAITVAVTATVLSDVFAFPALYAMTLGMVGAKGIVQQVPVNETATHCGNAFFAIFSGLLVAFTTDGGLVIFWICVAMRILSSLVLYCNIDDRSIDHNKARGLEVNSSPSKEEPALAPISYSVILTDFYVIIFLLSVMLFHFSNAAMLPLLSQQLFISNAERGFEFAAMAVITAQLSMVASACAAGWMVPRVGTKPLFIVALSAIPIRGVIIVALLAYYADAPGSNVLLLSTQLLDGLAGGIFGVLLVLISENLARGSGRFAMLVGLAKTSEGVGASFSNLVGEYIAEVSGYQMAFTVLSVASIVPILLYGICMPSAQFKDDGTAVDELSVSSHHHDGLKIEAIDVSDDIEVELSNKRWIDLKPMSPTRVKNSSSNVVNNVLHR